MPLDCVGEDCGGASENCPDLGSVSGRVGRIELEASCKYKLEKANERNFPTMEAGKKEVVTVGYSGLQWVTVGYSGLQWVLDQSAGFVLVLLLILIFVFQISDISKI